MQTNFPSPETHGQERMAVPPREVPPPLPGRFPRLFPAALGGLLLGWLGYAVAGRALGRFTAARFGGIVDRCGGSKIPDAAEFVTGRLYEACWLASVTLLAVALAVVFWRWLERRAAHRAAFLGGGLGLFLLLNLWSYAAGKTALFWLVLRGTSVENQAQFRAKERLLREVNLRPRLALVGSSQSRAQIVEEEFNEALAGKAWMMELHFPGSMASDVFFVGERFGRETVDAFVYYTSPMSFYSVNDSAIGRDLFRLCDLPESLSLGTWKQFGPETARYTALGMLLPLFQYRPVFQHALFGDAMPRVETAPAAPIAHREASTLRPGPSADYQKAAFVRFLEHCAAKNQQVILIGGQFNPLQEAQMDPEVRPAYEGFLKECASRYPNVVLVWQKELLVQPPEAYVDETHVSEETQKRFTKAFADWYRQSGQAQRDLFTPRAAAAR